MIIRTQSRALFAIAYGIVQNRADAEDVVQESLVKAWKSRWKVRDPQKFPAWLSTIVEASRARRRAEAQAGSVARRLRGKSRRGRQSVDDSLGQKSARRSDRTAGAASVRAHPSLF